MAIDKAAISDALAALPKDATADQYHMALEAALLAQAAVSGEPLDAPKAEGEAEAPEMSAELSAPPPAVEAAAEPGAAPASDAATMALAKLMEATGLDEAGVVAFLGDNAEALAKLAGKQADSGTTAAPADASAMAQDITAAKLAATQAQLTVATQQLSAYKAREAAVALSNMEARVDAAVAAGHILPQFKATFIKLGRMDSKALDEELCSFAKSPSVPTGTLIKASAGTTDFGNDAAEKRILRDLRGSSKETIAWALAEHRKQAGKTDRV
jgi:hypothetical protein